jgi:hypothetical protein
MLSFALLLAAAGKRLKGAVDADWETPEFRRDQTP